MNIVSFLLGLIPASVTIPLPAETVSVELLGQKFTVSTPAISVAITKV